jgi:1-acyl-sn-glycerol-3-phosphate acyltransferase
MDEVQGDDTGRTVELAVSDIHGRLPASQRDDLRDKLPGLESERRITDWGRSERIEVLADRTVYGFLFNYWFRVEADGLENIPSDGGALLVANHAGPAAADGAMIAKAVRDRHPARRPVHLASTRSVRRVPGLGMLATKLGAVSPHPANLQRLLFDERELVLSFPEGSAGSRKALHERYRLRRFEPEFVQTALRARVPVVPVATVGAEESLPRISLLRSGVPLPAKFRLRFLEAVPADRLEAGSAQEIQALVQENVLEMVASRRSVWLG